MKDIAGISIITYWWYTRADIGVGKKKGIFFVSKSYIDDVFTLKDLLGLEKIITKNLLSKTYLSWFKFSILDFWEMLYCQIQLF